MCAALPDTKAGFMAAMGHEDMTLYLLKEIACCVLLAAAVVGFTGGSVLAWKAAARLVSGIRQVARPALESLSADLERRLAGVWISQDFRADFETLPVTDSYYRGRVGQGVVVVENRTQRIVAVLRDALRWCAEAHSSKCPCGNDSQFQARPGPQLDGGAVGGPGPAMTVSKGGTACLEPYSSSC